MVDDGRFDESFLVRTIRDFFLVLLLIVVLELGIRFVVILYEYANAREAEVEHIAERLAGDVKSIMLNEGGPVAARTIYPMFQKNMADLGVEIAILPSAVTKKSIAEMFDFDPQGIAAAWSPGAFKQASIALHAEPFCLQCHVDARPGDVLGEVVVRSYFSEHVRHWWQEVRVAGLVGMANILLHTIMLFLVLKLRMAPVLALRDAVSLLAKAGSNLSHRAQVMSRDEFGQLAHDVNLFVTRIAQITEDVGGVLRKVDALNSRLYQVREQIGDQAQGLRGRVGAITRRAVAGDDDLPAIGQSARQMVDALCAVITELPLPAPGRERIEATLAAWRETMVRLEARAEARSEIATHLVELNHEVGEFSHFLDEMTVLEERMAAVAHEGQALLKRILPPEPTTA